MKYAIDRTKILFYWRVNAVEKKPLGYCFLYFSFLFCSGTSYLAFKSEPGQVCPVLLNKQKSTSSPEKLSFRHVKYNYQ
jgi:hypothetical protein